MLFRLQFRPRYLLVAFFLLVVEVCIALFVDDAFIRPYFGDFLVVILIYYFVKAFVRSRPLPLAVVVLLFAYSIETLQYFNLVEKLHLQRFKLAKVVLGTSFEWTDILAYTLGIAVVLLWEKRNRQPGMPNQ